MPVRSPVATPKPALRRVDSVPRDIVVERRGALWRRLDARGPDEEILLLD